MRYLILDNNYHYLAGITLLVTILRAQQHWETGVTWEIIPKLVRGGVLRCVRDNAGKNDLEV